MSKVKITFAGSQVQRGHWQPHWRCPAVLHAHPTPPPALEWGCQTSCWSSLILLTSADCKEIVALSPPVGRWLQKTRQVHPSLQGFLQLDSHMFSINRVLTVSGRGVPTGPAPTSWSKACRPMRDTELGNCWPIGNRKAREMLPACTNKYTSSIYQEPFYLPRWQKCQNVLMGFNNSVFIKLLTKLCTKDNW